MKYIFITLAILLSFKTDIFAQAPAKVIPSFTFKRLNKKEFTNKELEPGKLLFFVFFDSECDHCQRSIQYIGQHYGNLKKQLFI
jgi:AhpC/TSA family